MSCKFDISLKFQKFCRETAELYFSLYSRYAMSQTVHKVLFHSTAVINILTLLLGTCSGDLGKETPEK